MKLLLLHTRYQQRGGEDVCVDSQIRLFKSRGHQVLLLEAENSEIKGLVGKVRAAATSIHSPIWSARVSNVIKEFRPDVAHVHNTFPLMSASVLRACRRASVPVVQTLHNYRLACSNGLLFRDGHVCVECLTKTVAWNGVLHGCYRDSRVGSATVAAMSAFNRISGTYATGVDAVIVLSEFARTMFTDIGLRSDKLEVVPNFVISDPGFGNGEGGFFLFAGRLSREKGVETLLRAWETVKSGAQLVMVGSGPLEVQVAEAVRRNPSIRWLGFQPPEIVHDLMRKAAAVIAPSECFEGCPMAVIEAFAAGTPVLGSDIGGLGSMLRYGIGMKCRPGDPRALAASVDQFVYSDNQSEMRRAARAEYESNYSAEVAYHRLMNLFARLTSAACDARCS